MPPSGARRFRYGSDHVALRLGHLAGKRIRILEAIVAAGNGIKLSEIARGFDMPASNLTDLAVIRRELDTVRSRGYAINRGEYDAEVMAVAAPIFVGASIGGSLVVQFPTFRHAERDLEGHAGPIVDAASRISRLLN